MNRLLTLSNDEVTSLCRGYDEDLYDLAITAMHTTVESEESPDCILATVLSVAFAAGRRLEAEGALEG